MIHSRYYFKRDKMIFKCIISFISIITNIIAMIFSIYIGYKILLPILFLSLAIYFLIEAILSLKKISSFKKRWKEKIKEDEISQKLCPYKIETDGSYGGVND